MRNLVNHYIYRGKNLAMLVPGVARLLEPEDLIKLPSPPQSHGEQKYLKLGLINSWLTIYRYSNNISNI